MSSESSDSYLKLNKDQFNSWIDDFEQKYNKIEKNNTDSNELESIDTDSSYLENNINDSDSNQDLNDTENTESSNVFIKRRVLLNRKPIIRNSQSNIKTESSQNNIKTESFKNDNVEKVKKKNYKKPIVNNNLLSTEKSVKSMKSINLKQKETKNLEIDNKLLIIDEKIKSLTDLKINEEEILSIKILNNIVNNLIEKNEVKKKDDKIIKNKNKNKKKNINDNYKEKNNMINLALLKFIREKNNYR